MLGFRQGLGPGCSGVRVDGVRLCKGVQGQNFGVVAVGSDFGHRI